MAGCYFVHYIYIQIFKAHTHNFGGLIIFTVSCDLNIYCIFVSLIICVFTKPCELCASTYNIIV